MKLVVNTFSQALLLVPMDDAFKDHQTSQSGLKLSQNES